MGIPRGEIYYNSLHKVHWRLAQMFGGWQWHNMHSVFRLSQIVQFRPLVVKLTSYRLNCMIIRIKHYLAERTQVVAVDGFESNPLPVLSGVPQGSIPGPLLFLLYINDLPNAVQDTIIPEPLCWWYSTLPNCCVCSWLSPSAASDWMHWAVVNRQHLDFNIPSVSIWLFRARGTLWNQLLHLHSSAVH